MAEALKIGNSETPEDLAWDLLETGSYDEVIRISESYPQSVLLDHIRFLAEWEGGFHSINTQVNTQTSRLSPLLEAYFLMIDGKISESATQFHSAIQTHRIEVPLAIQQTAIRVSRDAKDYRICLDMIGLYQFKYGKNFYSAEELICLFHLGRFSEVLVCFQKHGELLKDDAQCLTYVGMSLLHLGRTREAESLISKLPKKLKIPTFQEKKEEYSSVIQELPKLEKKISSLSRSERIQVGFAYLFSENYKKAEEIFTNLVASVSQ